MTRSRERKKSGGSVLLLFEKSDPIHSVKEIMKGWKKAGASVASIPAVDPHPGPFVLRPILPGEVVQGDAQGVPGW